MTIDTVLSFFGAIPRKVKYLALTLLLYGLKSRFPGAPLPEPQDLEWLVGGGLIGGHVLTDVATNIGAFRANVRGDA